MSINKVEAYEAIDGSLWKTKEDAETRNEKVAYERTIKGFDSVVENSLRSDGIISHKDLYQGFLYVLLSNKMTTKSSLRQLHKRIEDEIDY